MRKVEVVPHTPEWQRTFELEAQRIASALGKNVIEVYVNAPKYP